MRTSHITRKLKTKAKKLNIRIERDSYNHETGIASYSLIQDTDWFYELRVSFDVDVKNYTPEYIEPMILIGQDLLKKQFEDLKFEMKKQDIEDVNIIGEQND